MYIRLSLALSYNVLYDLSIPHSNYEIQRRQQQRRAQSKGSCVRAESVPLAVRGRARASKMMIMLFLLLYICIYYLRYITFCDYATHKCALTIFEKKKCRKSFWYTPCACRRSSGGVTWRTCAYEWLANIFFCIMQGRLFNVRGVYNIQSVCVLCFCPGSQNKRVHFNSRQRHIYIKV